MKFKHHIPNLLTLCNLLCGTISILFLFQLQIDMVAMLIVFCLVFDVLDGLIARMLRVSSDLGKQLDSLADMISFGVVPGFVMMMLIQETTGKAFPPENTFSWYAISLLIPLGSAIRLARFNLDSRQENKFLGLPTPANTLLILSFWLVMHYQPDSWMSKILHDPKVLMGITVLSFILMISNLPLIALKFQNFSLKDNLFRYLLLLAGLLLLMFLQFSAVPLIILLYILFSLWANYLQHA